ncbi:hypothetical protein B6N60_05180 [Richelia sinica FACHB-800]|uniref:Uncharacterized protein n=1 Tax=Richelia sinica FACHB-800 TaxID=1357546 RepID=A0A975TCU1_9NOST|nr:hypothetical protein B6N60_05180 [Richelia sinica FACHB-800]
MGIWEGDRCLGIVGERSLFNEKIEGDIMAVMQYGKQL